MSAGDVAVMTSPRVDVSWRRSGTWRRVYTREESSRRVEVREEVRRCVEAGGVREGCRRIFGWRVRAREGSGDFEAFPDV